LALFTWLSRRNNRDRKAIISFKAQEYRFAPGEGGGLYLEHVGMLDETEVKKVCNKLETVQKHTDAAADEWRPYRGDLTATDYGTFVHVELKNQIEKLNDPDLKAEVSIKKADQVPPGEKKAIRVDAIENRGGGTFCVYDVKTGLEGLTMDRMDEIAETIAKKFHQSPTHIIVIEVRPTR
jgi:hypothetical protein